MTREWNYSKHSDYHSQRNNALIPMSACNVTSYIMAMKQAGWPVDEETPEGRQPEDYLMDFLLNGRYTDSARDRFASWSEDIPANQVHVLLSWGANRLFGGEQWSIDGPVSKFVTELGVPDMLTKLSQKHGIVLSGNFDLPDGREFGHIVSLAGVGLRTWNCTAQLDVLLEGREDEDWYVENVPYFIIDDPYGDYHSGYTDHRGNDVKMPYDDFVDTFKPVGVWYRKWAHIVYPHGTA